MGEISAGLERATGAHLPNVAALRHLSKREVLKAAGVSKDEAHRCEQIARVPQEAQ